mmetsp:Transcript_4807/g.16567  ORF Transcript_4807/g.16567 Transcript_4807/m.16567 type:complete len:394 (+) Transcript_4807:371-1552(+)
MRLHEQLLAVRAVHRTSPCGKTGELHIDDVADACKTDIELPQDVDCVPVEPERVARRSAPLPRRDEAVPEALLGRSVPRRRELVLVTARPERVARHCRDGDAEGGFRDAHLALVDSEAAFLQRLHERLAEVAEGGGVAEHRQRSSHLRGSCRAPLLLLWRRRDSLLVRRRRLARAATAAVGVDTPALRSTRFIRGGCVRRQRKQRRRRGGRAYARCIPFQNAAHAFCDARLCGEHPIPEQPPPRWVIELQSTESCELWNEYLLQLLPSQTEPLASHHHLHLWRGGLEAQPQQRPDATKADVSGPRVQRSVQRPELATGDGGRGGGGGTTRILRCRRVRLEPALPEPSDGEEGLDGDAVARGAECTELPLARLHSERGLPGLSYGAGRHSQELR